MMVTHQIADLSLSMEGKRVKIGGIVAQVKKINTRNGQPMAFVTVEDLSGKTEILVFPKMLVESPEAWQNDKLVLVSGKLSAKDKEVKILADKVEIFNPEKVSKEAKELASDQDSQGHMVTVDVEKDEIVEIDLSQEPEVNTLSASIGACFKKGNYLCQYEDQVFIVLPKSATKSKLLEIKEVLSKLPGDKSVSLAYKQNGDFKFAKTKMTTEFSQELNQELKNILS